MLVYVNSKEILIKVIKETRYEICVSDTKFINKPYEGWIESTQKDDKVYSRFVSNEYMVNSILNNLDKRIMIDDEELVYDPECYEIY